MSRSSRPAAAARHRASARPRSGRRRVGGGSPGASIETVGGSISEAKGASGRLDSLQLNDCQGDQYAKWQMWTTRDCRCVPAARHPRGRADCNPDSSANVAVVPEEPRGARMQEPGQDPTSGRYDNFRGLSLWRASDRPGHPIAARVSARASASEVLASRTVKYLVVGSGLALIDRGTHQLKGVRGARALRAGARAHGRSSRPASGLSRSTLALARARAGRRCAPRRRERPRPARGSSRAPSPSRAARRGGRGT
jgi:hypothetical protein